MLPTGEQHFLRLDGTRGEVTALVVELAAGLRSLSVDGADLVQRYPDDRIAPFGAGIVLVPWPNRVADGIWTLDGEKQSLDISEPSTGNATHGLLRNVGYTVTDREEHAVTLAATVFPQHGYPFLLQTSVRYELTDDGLQVTHGIVNQGETTAPVAIGAHPYLRAGHSAVDDLTLTVDADTWYALDDRFIPTGTDSVEGTDNDLRGGRRVGDVSLNVALTGLVAHDGVYRHRLSAPDGVTTELWASDDFAYVQVFTRPGFPDPDGEALAVAIEPMTAPADALNSGEGLRWLAPGEEWLTTWGISRLA